MARTVIASQTPKGPYPGTLTATGLDITFTVADISNKNSTPFVGNRMLILWRNDDAGSVSVTITSIADSQGRSGDVTDGTFETTKSGAFLVERDGWQQTDGSVYFEASDADCKFAVLAIP
jgi:hypothetical protein